MNLQENHGKVGMKIWLNYSKNSNFVILSFLVYFRNLKEV